MSTPVSSTGYFALGAPDKKQPMIGDGSVGIQGAPTAATGMLSLGGPTGQSGATTGITNAIGTVGTGAINQAGDAGALNYDGVSGVPGMNDFGKERDDTINKVGSYLNSRLDQRYGQEQQGFDQRMANQGVDIGSERYKNELRAYSDNKNRAYSDANIQALQLGNEEQSRLFGMGAQSHQMGVSDKNQLHKSRYDDITSLLGAGSPYAAINSQEGQNDKQREFDASESQFQRIHEGGLQDDDQGFQGKENELTRQLQEKLGTNDKDLINKVLAMLGVSPGGGGSTAPSAGNNTQAPGGSGTSPSGPIKTPTGKK